MIEFEGFGEGGRGFFYIRKIDGRVAITTSLADNGDVEATVDQDVVVKLLDLLSASISE